MALTNQLVIMAKEPRIGRVKTRLAADIGRVRAWQFYRRTLSGISRSLAADQRWTTWLSVSPDRSATRANLWPVTTRRMAQGHGDLGRRMGRVMEMMAPGPVVIIGADIPDIQSHHIAEAFRYLGDHDAVFGPANDGGYWLVGLKRRPGLMQIFSGVRWSSEHALDDTEARMAKGAKIAHLETLSDIDDGCDFRAFSQMATRNR